MKATELQDEAMDMIVGGSSYMSDLSEFILSSSKGGYFQASYGRSSSSSSKVSISQMTLCYGADDKGMAKLIEKATKYGTVTLSSASGTKKTFTAEQLTAML